jgi:hypothetical protein
VRHHALAALLGTLALLQDGAPPAPPDPYPPVRNASVVRFYVIEGELGGGAVQKVANELSTKEFECQIVAGPRASSTRPDKLFLAFEVPAQVAAKDVVKALKKANPRVTELEWTFFRGAPDEPGPILGYSARDCVIGMASEMRWFEFGAGTSAFFYLPGKLEAKSLRDRYHKLYQPLGGGELGELARDKFGWRLATPLDEGAARRAEKAIAKIPGVREAKIDAAGGNLGVTVELDQLTTSAPMSAAPSAKEGERAGPLRPKFDTNPVLDVLEKEHLALAPPPSEETDKR